MHVFFCYVRNKSKIMNDKYLQEFLEELLSLVMERYII